MKLAILGGLIATLAAIAHGFESRATRTLTVGVDLTGVMVSSGTVTSTDTVKVDR